jgi:plastocyanin
VGIVRSVRSCVLAILVAPSVLGAQQSATPERAVTGRVEGTVTLAARLSSRKPRVRLDAVYGAPAAPRRPVNELTNVVVYLDAVAPPYPAASDTAHAIRQVHEAFVPHVLPVAVGATVNFPNEDPFFHNVFSLSKAGTFDLGRYPTGTSKSVTFDRPGTVQVFCHIHSDMRATVLVLENPYFVVVDSAGRFVLPAVPPGEFDLVAWHERIQPARRRVSVRPGGTSTVRFEIPLPPPDSTTP